MESAKIPKLLQNELLAIENAIKSGKNTNFST